MPIVNGRFYTNPQYGAALERARTADEDSIRANGAPQPSWLDRFLGIVPTGEEQEQMSQGDNGSSYIFPKAIQSGDPYELGA